jgi:hypothetical protein
LDLGGAGAGEFALFAKRILFTSPAASLRKRVLMLFFHFCALMLGDEKGFIAYLLTGLAFIIDLEWIAKGIPFTPSIRPFFTSVANSILFYGKIIENDISQQRLL